MTGTIERSDEGNIIVNYSSHGHKKEFEIQMDSTSYCVGYIVIVNVYNRWLNVYKIHYLKFKHKPFVRLASWTVQK